MAANREDYSDVLCAKTNQVLHPELVGVSRSYQKGQFVLQNMLHNFSVTYIDLDRFSLTIKPHVLKQDCWVATG